MPRPGAEGWRRAREVAYEAAFSRAFEAFIFVCILFNSVTIAIDTPDHQGSARLQRFLRVTELVFVGIFTLELAVKVFAMGLRRPDGYFCDRWNWLDAVVVVVGILGLLPGFKSGTTIKCIRVLRPLRTVSRLRRLRVLVFSIAHAIPTMANVMLLLLLLLYIYAVLGVQLWAGALHMRCYRPSSAAEQAAAAAANSTAAEWVLEQGPRAQYPCVSDQGCSFSSCGRTCPAGYTCARHPDLFMAELLNYDNTANALLMTFKITTLDNWQEEILVARYASSPVSVTFFITLTFLGAMLCFNMVTGALTRNFSQMSRQYRDQLLQERSARRGIFYNAKVVVPPEPYFSDVEAPVAPQDVPVWLRCCARFTTVLRRAAESTPFNVVLALVTVLNFLALCTVHYGMPSTHRTIVEIISNTCAAVFIAEAVLKIIAYQRGYFADWSNVVDFLLVLLSIPQMARAGSKTIMLSSLRVLRALRLLRYGARWQALAHIARALESSLAELLCLGGLLLLAVWITGLLGSQLLFASFPPGYRWNCNTLWEALLFSFVLLTGENWSDTMRVVVAYSDKSFLALWFVTLTAVRYVAFNMPSAILLEHLRGAREETQVSSEAVQHVMSALTAREEQYQFYDELDAEAELLRPSERSAANAGVRTRRERVAELLEHRYVQTAVLLLVLANCVELAVEYSYRRSHDNQPIDYVFALIFVVEIVVKLICHGPQVYLRDGYNRLDAAVALSCLASLALPKAKVLRSLRAIRLVLHTRGAKRMLSTLVQAAPGLLSVIALCAFFFLIFAVIGVQLFMGRMWNCSECGTSGCTVTARSTAHCTRQACEAAGLVWRETRMGYNHVGVALLALFQMSIGEKWSELMLDGIDAGELDTCLRPRQSPANCLYFVVFMFFSYYFAMRLLVAVLVEQFTRITHLEFMGWTHLSEEQAMWLCATSLALQAPRGSRGVPRSEWAWRARVQRLVERRGFEYLSIAVILFNALVFGLHSDAAPATLTAFINVINLICLVFFTIESLLRLVASGRAFAFDAWNLFDCGILAASWLSFGLDTILHSSPVLSVLRLVRAARVLRIIPRLRRLRLLFSTLLYSLPPLLNVAVLLCTVYFIFGLIGVELFSRVRRDNTLNDMFNFETMYNSGLVLYVLSTSEMWTDVLASCSKQPPLCDPAAGDCGFRAAPLFFVTFVFCCTILLTNLAIAVIIENFEAREILRDPRVAGLPDFQRFWLSVDSGQRQKISYKTFLMMFRICQQPLGLLGTSNRKRLLLIELAALHLPIGSDGTVQYEDCVQALLRRVFGLSLTECKMVQHLAKARFGSQRSIFAQLWCVHQDLAARMLQRAFRSRSWHGATPRAIESPASDPAPTWLTWTPPNHPNSPQVRLEMSEDEGYGRVPVATTVKWMSVDDAEGVGQGIGGNDVEVSWALDAALPGTAEGSEVSAATSPLLRMLLPPGVMVTPVPLGTIVARSVVPRLPPPRPVAAPHRAAVVRFET